MDSNMAILKGLADKNRFQIINMLLKHDFCVGALAHSLGISKAAVSQHLQILRKAGLVRGEKRGYWTHYSVSKEAIHQIAGELKNMADEPPCTESVCFMKCPDSETSDKKEADKSCKGQCKTFFNIQDKP